MPAVILVTANAVYLYPSRHMPRLQNGMLGLLHQCDRSFSRAGVVLVDAGGAALLGLPEKLPRKPIMTPAILTAHNHNWKGTAKLQSPWLNFYRDGSPNVAICVLSYLTGPDDAGMIDPCDVKATMHRLDRWHQMTGAPWTTGPGTTGVNLMREVCAPVFKGAPLWTPSMGHIPPAAIDMQVEAPLRWTAPAAPPGRFRHGFDANRARLQYFGQTKFARGPLTHTDLLSRPVDRSTLDALAGWVRIDRVAWNPDDFPHPAGYRGETAQVIIPAARKGAPPKITEWVSMPTVQNVLDVAEQGYCAAPTLYEGWLAPAATLWRRWADALERVWQISNGMMAGPVKEVYRQTSGQLRKDTGRIARKDWYDALIGSERSWLWRKWWRAYLAGYTPAEIQTDAVWYNSDHPDWRHSAPDALPIGDGLGQFHPLPTTALDDQGAPLGDAAIAELDAMRMSA